MSNIEWKVIVTGQINPEAAAVVVDAIEEHAMQLGAEYMRIHLMKLPEEPAESIYDHASKRSEGIGA